MKKIKIKRKLNLFLVIISIFLVAVTHNVALAQTTRQYQKITYPPLAEIKIPEYERYQLDNGMVIYLSEDHRLPLITGTALIKTGAKFEPESKIGLAELTGNLMRSGGTVSHSDTELNQILEQIAAGVESQINNDSGSVSFTALSYDLDTVFDLFTEVIRQPIFSEKSLVLEKTKLSGEIARRNDDPKDIASREFGKLIYGKNSPYARSVEYKTLNNITREDIISFYRQSVRPDQIILSISGDFNTKEMKKIVNSAFGDWQNPATPKVSQIEIPTQNTTQGTFLVDQPQLTQSNILLGHIGGELSNPDYPTLTVINGILNGFGGRLHNQIRSKQGLAYSVYGVWNAAYDHPGVFVAGGQTKSETTVDFIQSLYAEIEKLRKYPISDAELNYAKESILNSFVFKFAQPNQIINRLVTYEYYGYPADFIFKYQKAVKETTVEDVLRVAKKYLQPDQIITLIVGNGEVMETSLANLKTSVKTIDVTIPDTP